MKPELIGLVIGVVTGVVSAIAGVLQVRLSRAQLRILLEQTSRSDTSASSGHMQTPAIAVIRGRARRGAIITGVGLMVIGICWLAGYYVMANNLDIWPFGELGDLNIALSLAMVVLGLVRLVTSRQSAR